MAGRDRRFVLVTGLQGTGKSTVADAAGRRMGAPVFAFDWAMSGLRPFPAVQQSLASMGPAGHREVGWSILLALARSQLRRGGSGVLDGVARAREVDLCRGLAAEEGARLAVIATECDDVVVHRSRIEGRKRSIPNWYELDWEHVKRSRDSWTPVRDADLVLSATQPLECNLEELNDFLQRFLRGQ